MVIFTAINILIATLVAVGIVAAIFLDGVSRKYPGAVCTTVLVVALGIWLTLLHLGFASPRGSYDEGCGVYRGGMDACQ